MAYRIFDQGKNSWHTRTYFSRSGKSSWTNPYETEDYEDAKDVLTCIPQGQIWQLIAYNVPERREVV